MTKPKPSNDDTENGYSKNSSQRGREWLATLPGTVDDEAFHIRPKIGKPDSVVEEDVAVMASSRGYAYQEHEKFGINGKEQEEEGQTHHANGPRNSILSSSFNHITDMFWAKTSESPHETLNMRKFRTAIEGDLPETKFKDNCASKVVQHKFFETTTLFVISLNALWIGVDMELNNEPTWLTAHPVFMIADNGFCVYFTFEVCIRFCAFQSMRDIRREYSYLFDCALVLLMIGETWVLVIVTKLNGGGGAGGMRQISILRLLRLLRLTRMVRLMRAFPELMTLMKGLFKALRSVGTTLLFQISCLWVFGIIFVGQYRDSSDEQLRAYFKRLGITMVTLFVQGTLLDELADLASLLKEDNLIFLAILFVFILLSSLTLLNMLIGVLSQVVKEQGDNEKEMMLVQGAADGLRAVFEIVDTNGDRRISCQEFEEMVFDEATRKVDLESPCVQALVALGIHPDRLADLSRQLFEEETNEQLAAEKNSAGKSYQKMCSNVTLDRDWPSKTLSFTEFMEELLSLKPGTKVSVRDIMALRRHASAISRRINEKVSSANKEIEQMTNGSGVAFCDHHPESEDSSVHDIDRSDLANGFASESAKEPMPPTPFEDEVLTMAAKPPESSPYPLVLREADRGLEQNAVETYDGAHQGKLSEVPTDMIVEEVHRRFRLYAGLMDVKSGNSKSNARPGAAPEEWYLVPCSLPNDLVVGQDTMYV